MIDKEIISKNEAENDGQTIHLYYDEIAGMYMAFGLSAYYTTMVTDPYMSFSEALQKPVALLRREHVFYLRRRRGTSGVPDCWQSPYRRRATGIQRWASGILERHGQMAKYT